MTSLTASHYLLDIKLRRDRVPNFETYPYSLPAIKELGTLKLHPKVTFIVGENGSGKSTLLEAIATAWGIQSRGRPQNLSSSRRSAAFFAAWRRTLTCTRPPVNATPTIAPYRLRESQNS